MLEKEDLRQIKDIIDASLEEKLGEKLEPIRQDIRIIKIELEELNQKVEEIKRMETEDIGAVGKEVQELRNKLFELEKRVESLC